MNTLAPSFLNQSSSFLQVTRTCIKAWMGSNFGQVPTQTPELSALARLKNCCIYVVTTLGFGPDRIGTLVSMATDSSHRVIMGKMLCLL